MYNFEHKNKIKTNINRNAFNPWMFKVTNNEIETIKDKMILKITIIRLWK